MYPKKLHIEYLDGTVETKIVHSTTAVERHLGSNYAWGMIKTLTIQHIEKETH